MAHEHDEANLMGQVAGIIAMMSALVQALPATTRKRLLQQSHTQFESLLAAMSTTVTADAHTGREGAEWIRDLFLKQIAKADTQPRKRRTSRAAGGPGRRAPRETHSQGVEDPAPGDVDFLL